MPDRSHDLAENLCELCELCDEPRSEHYKYCDVCKEDLQRDDPVGWESGRYCET